MKSFLLGFVLVGVMGLALWAYSENYATKQTLDEVAQLNRDIAVAKSRLRVLNAEWAYLNRPERLVQLANDNFNHLQLLQLTPHHFAKISDIPYPKPDLGPIINPVEVMDRGANQ